MTVLVTGTSHTLTATLSSPSTAKIVMTCSQTISISLRRQFLNLATVVALQVADTVQNLEVSISLPRAQYVSSHVSLVSRKFEGTLSHVRVWFPFLVVATPSLLMFLRRSQNILPLVLAPLKRMMMMRHFSSDCLSKAVRHDSKKEEIETISQSIDRSTKNRQI